MFVWHECVALAWGRCVLTLRPAFCNLAEFSVRCLRTSLALGGWICCCLCCCLKHGSAHQQHVVPVCVGLSTTSGVCS